MEKSKNLIDLYSEKILRLAADISMYDRLTNPDISIKKRAPICGSQVTIDLKLERNKISAYGHDIKACALGQASASILSQEIIGKTGSDIIKARDTVVKMLNGEKYQFEQFKDFEFLHPASDYKHRHASILLVIEATIEGLSQMKII